MGNNALKKRIIVIEDDPHIAELIVSSFPAKDFFAEYFLNGTDGLQAISRNKYDLLVLDWELPDMSGPQIIRLLRASKNDAALPIVMLTVKKETGQVTAALELGADEYITKPFKPRELCARVQALLRRIDLKEPALDFIKHGDLAIQVRSRSVTVKSMPVDLTEREYQLLLLLSMNAGRTVTCHEMIERIWGYEYEAGDVVGSKIRVLIQRLRTKLGKQVSGRILPIYGVGYRFEDK